MRILKYFTTESVETLRDSVETHLEWYRNPLGDHPLLSTLEVRETTITYRDFSLSLLKEPRDDVSNSLIAHIPLRVLTPHQASVERIWVYLCHTDAAMYVVKRWPLDQQDEKAISTVLNHFFAKSARNLIRDNGVARLWWLGKIANDIDEKDPKLFLQILWHNKDVVVSLLGRPATSMNPYKLRCYYEILRYYWELKDLRLFERKKFRKWMKSANRLGGMLLLDSMPEKELYSNLIEEALIAINEAGIDNPKTLKSKVMEIYHQILQRRQNK